MKKVAIEIVKWIQEQVKNANASGVIVGLSGGVDSSLVAVLCKEAFPEKVLGLIMPCHSISKDRVHAELVAVKYNIPTRVIDLSSIYDAFARLMENAPGIVSHGVQVNNVIGAASTEGHAAGILCKDKPAMALANLKPRLRMLVLYYHANMMNYLVAGTGNKSETIMGYFTKYGDGGVDILPIGGLLKTEVREMAKVLGIPEEIIIKPPSAGLWEGQTDEDEMGISYDLLDRVIGAIESGSSENTNNINSQMFAKVQATMRQSEHKRRLPLVCLVPYNGTDYLS